MHCACGWLCVLGWGERGWGRDREVCDICADVDQILYPITEKDFMQLSKRYSPETSSFAKDIAWNQVFYPKGKLKKGNYSYNNQRIFHPKSKLIYILGIYI